MTLSFTNVRNAVVAYEELKNPTVFWVIDSIAEIIDAMESLTQLITHGFQDFVRLK
jgi:hypothetical protein